MNIQKTKDYDLDHALFNWDNLTWLIKVKIKHKKKKYLGGYIDWYTCKYCSKIIPPDLWFTHKENCVRDGVFRFFKKWPDKI